ncbi:MAG: hypothetical protein ACD_34C00006G0002 [uncultured bacterium]|nr:MAG: hypothetical protein ACD_34C00006G0002 [uncultured bacterium]
MWVFQSAVTRPVANPITTAGQKPKIPAASIHGMALNIIITGEEDSRVMFGSGKLDCQGSFNPKKSGNNSEHANITKNTVQNFFELMI